jgi:hypothetical protein
LCLSASLNLYVIGKPVELGETKRKQARRKKRDLGEEVCKKGDRMGGHGPYMMLNARFGRTVPLVTPV